MPTTRFENKSIDTVLGRFHLKYRLGSGAFGSVYESRINNHQVAVKIVSCHTKHEEHLFDCERICIDRLRNVRHRNIVPVLGCTMANNFGIFVFGLAPQGALEGFVRNQGPLAVHHAWRLFEQMLEGLAYLHVMGIFHRDVKPANVLLMDPFNCQLTDFGLAHCNDLRKGNFVPIFNFEEKCGSDTYLPPELHDIGEYAADRGDLWAAVLTFTFMIAGRTPWQIASRARDFGFKLFGERNLCHLFPAWMPLQNTGLLGETLAMLEPVYTMRKYPGRYVQALQIHRFRHSM